MALLTWSKEVEAITVAAIAGLLGYLMRTIQSGRRIRALQAVVETAAAGLVGYMACHLCEGLGIGREWSSVIIGVLGWVGASGSVVILQRLAFRRFGIEEKDHVAPGRDRTPK